MFSDPSNKLPRVFNTEETTKMTGYFDKKMFST